MIEPKKPTKVCRRNFSYLVRWQVSHITDGLRHFRDIGRLISFSPAGLRCQERRIGFHKQMVERNIPRYVPQILRFGIRHISSE